ncbi:unnamed protein product [Closterium sp. Naga37s-1]|nr:unnamed protein product [Closterium sp. Naga37s-1]
MIRLRLGAYGLSLSSKQPGQTPITELHPGMVLSGEIHHSSEKKYQVTLLESWIWVCAGKPTAFGWFARNMARATPTRSAHCSQPSITYPSTPPHPSPPVTTHHHPSPPIPTRPHPSPPVPTIPTHLHPSPPQEFLEANSIRLGDPNPGCTLQNDMRDAGRWARPWGWGEVLSYRNLPGDSRGAGFRYLPHR